MTSIDTAAPVVGRPGTHLYALLRRRYAPASLRSVLSIPLYGIEALLSPISIEPLAQVAHLVGAVADLAP